MTLTRFSFYFVCMADGREPIVAYGRERKRNLDVQDCEEEKSSEEENSEHIEKASISVPSLQGCASSSPIEKAAACIAKTNVRSVLAESQANVRSCKQQQMTLDLGQKLRIECKTCGMSYDRSDAGDSTTHKRFHRDATHGMEWKVRRGGRWIAKHTIPAHAVRSLGASQAGHSDTLRTSAVELLAFDLGDLAALDSNTNRTLQQVQERMDTALGAVPVHLDTFSARRDCVNAGERKIIVAIWQNRVVGSALVGSVPKDRVFRLDLSASNAVIVDRNPIPAEQAPPLGIHRIHVVPLMRRSGVAKALLDAALADCVYGLTAEEVIRTHGRGFKANTTAFSQPTESGRFLAQSWITAADHERPDDGFSRPLLVFEDAVH